MSQFITGADVTMLIAVLAAIGGFWWRIDSRIRGIETGMTDIRLEMAKCYIPIDRLRETEERLMRALEQHQLICRAFSPRIDEGREEGKRP